MLTVGIFFCELWAGAGGMTMHEPTVLIAFIGYGAAAGIGLAEQRRDRDARGKRRVRCDTTPHRGLRGERETVKER
jgi:hypothetical protein